MVLGFLDRIFGNDQAKFSQALQISNRFLEGVNILFGKIVATNADGKIFDPSQVIEPGRILQNARCKMCRLDVSRPVPFFKMGQVKPWPDFVAILAARRRQRDFEQIGLPRLSRADMGGCPPCG